MKPSKLFTLLRPAPLRSALPGLLFLAAAACCVPAAAEIYGWTDASGVTTYSNLPPPKGAKLTDVIHETPMSPEALAEAAHRSEVSQLNDRIRLLELEMERQNRTVADYPAAPPQPAGIGCGPGGYGECDPAYDYGPYYTTSLLLPGNFYQHRDGHGNRPHSGGHPPHRGAPAPMHLSHVSTGHGSPGPSAH